MTTPLQERRRYQQIILSRSKKPRHFGQTDPIHFSQKGANPYCGDTVEITLALDQTKNKIEDLKFEGVGCALCLASADLMAETVQGKSIDETHKIIEHFHQVMLGQAELSPALNQLKAIEGVKRYPVKVKCTTLAWHTLKAALIPIRKSNERLN